MSSRGLEVSVAGGGQPQAGGGVRERAETYLRLLAETELRRALGSPVIRPLAPPAGSGRSSCFGSTGRRPHGWWLPERAKGNRWQKQAPGGSLAV